MRKNNVTPGDKIKNAIRKYFSISLNDFKSYDPVSYSTPEKVYVSFEELGLYDFLIRKADSCEKDISVSQSHIVSCTNAMESNNAEIKDDENRAIGSLPRYKKLYDSLKTIEVNKNEERRVKRSN